LVFAHRLFLSRLLKPVVGLQLLPGEIQFEGVVLVHRRIFAAAGAGGFDAAAPPSHLAHESVALYFLQLQVGQRVELYFPSTGVVAAARMR